MKRKTHEQYLKDILPENNHIIPLEDYRGAHVKIIHKCTKCGDEFLIFPFQMTTDHVKCHMCSSIWMSKYRDYFSQYLTEEQMKKYSLGTSKNCCLNALYVGI